MAADFHVETEESAHSMTSLVSDIVADVKDLLEQHFLLLQQTLYRDMQAGSKAVVLLVAGVCSALIAGMGLLLAAAYALHWAVPEIPFWGSLAIFGGGLACVAAGLIFKGLAFFDARKRGPTETAQAVKESVQCLKHNLKSS